MTFVVDQEVTARWMNDNVRDSLIIRCTSTSRPEFPFHGMEILETDTRTFRMYDEPTDTWVVVGSMLSTPYVWSPIFTGVSLSSMSIGRMFYNIIHRSIGLLSFWVTFSGAASGTITISLPADFATVDREYGYCGDGTIYDSSTGDIFPTVAHITAGTITLYSGSSNTVAPVSNTNPITFASGDIIAFSGVVEIQ